MFAASAAFFGYGFYSNVLERFLYEVQDETAGGVKGVGSVVIRKLGVFNRRFIWPTYEERMRKKLIKGGEPHAYKPEDILALQELGFILGLTLGMVLLSPLDVNLMWGFVAALGGCFYPMIWVNDQVKKRHLQISRALPY